MNFPPDSSTQTNTALATTGTSATYADSNDLSTKQNVLTASTNLLGIGTSISALNYSSITVNRPTNFQSDWNSTVINKPTNFQSDWNSTVINKPTNFQSDWNSTIINKPDLALYAVKSNVDSSLNSLNTNKQNNLTFTSPLTNTSNTISIDLSAYPLKSNVDSSLNSLNTNKQNVFTCVTPLIKNDISNNVSIDLSSYSTTGNDTNYLLKTGGTMTGNLNVNANITTQQLYINNQNSTASIIFSPNPSIYSIFSRKVPWAMYFAEDFNPSSPTVLPNYISNSRDATLSGTITKTTTTGPANGATGNITYISGGTGATISFPAGSIPSTFTILGLTRYNGETKRRIIQSSSGNWLHGHWAGNRGVAYYEGWKTSIASTGTQDNWLCFIGKNTGATSGNILVDGAGLGTATGGAGGGTYRLTVNISSSYDESSDWALSCVMIWDTALTDAEMQDLNTIINTYKNDGVSIKSLISTTIDDDSIIESRVYNGLEKTELLLFKGNDGTGTNGADRIRLKAGNIAFDTYSSLTPSSSRNNENIVMLINENGNVGIGTTTNLTSKLNINGSLNATSLSGDGANITNVPYSTITGKPTNFQADWTTTIINKPTNFQADWTTTIINKPTNFQADWTTTIINKPTTFPADMTNIYTKTETNNLLSAKEATLTFTSPLTRTTNSISFTESAITTLTNFYNKNDADNRYLKLSGGNLTGNVYGNDILLSVNKGSFKRIDTLSTSNVNVPGVGEEGPLTGGEKILLGPGTPTTHPYSIGLNTNVQWYSVPTGATQIFYIGGTAKTTISSTGLTTTGVINATTNLQENGTNLTSKYLQLTGGTMTGDLNISDSTGVNSSTFTRMFNIVGTQARLACWSSSTTASSGIELISAPTNGTTVPATFTSRWDLNCGNSTIGDIFYIRQRSSGTANTYFIIGPTGNVGIGSTYSASYKLNVDGALNSTSFYNNGTLINFSSYATNTNLTTNYYNKTDSDARYLKLTGGTLTGNLNLNTDNTVLSFGSRIDNYLIKLWGDYYGFGVNSGMLRYNSDGNHTFFCAGTQRANVGTTGLSVSGDITTTGSISTGASYYLYAGGLRIGGWDTENTIYNNNKTLAISVDDGYDINFNTWTGATNTRMKIKSSGRVGIANNAPLSMLHLGNCEVANSAPVIVFGKNYNSGFRNAFMGYTDTFYFVIGDYGNNNTSNALTQQVAIIYNAPALCLVLNATGIVTMQYGYTSISDERIKTNIKTIENALDKTLLLRGVEYNDIRIEPERKRIGMIAQEAELIIPEVIHTDEKGMKSIEYQNLVGLLIESIKELNNKVSKLENIIKNNNLI